MTDLDFLFNPRSIAVLGASSKPGKIGYEVLKSIIDAGYEQKIYPINIKGEEILGMKSYRSILDVQDDMDLAVFALPAKYAPKAMDECGQKGVSGVVIISGGFKELNGEGAELERRTMETAKRYGIRVIGPNCVGILGLDAKFDTFFQPNYAMSRPKKGNISVLTQSGTFGLSLLECFAMEGLGVSKFVSYGNKADVDELDMLRYLENDEDTKIIVLYVEGLPYGREFTELAKNIGKKKPIVMLKAGRTKSGAAAAKSHTGSLAGNDAVFIGAMRQSGVILVDDIDEVVDVVKILSMQPLPSGNKVAMVTNGVGPCVVATDEIEYAKNLKLSELDKETVVKLKEHLPDFCVFSNPLDLTGSATAEWFGYSIEILKQDENVNTIMPFFVFQDGPLSQSMKELHDFMNKFNDEKKPMVCVATGGEFTKKQAARLQKNGIPCLFTPKRAVQALDKVVLYANFLRQRANLSPST
ncbi:MAG: CoA-binding protein [Methanomassiliicoccales archaeon]|nr:MAG: CoA-binding protein [Methanomassiliicoccales archaeon]